MFACQFCKKEYKTASNLKLHIKTAKFCLKIQEEKSPNNTSIVKNKTKSCHTCSFCKKEFALKHRYETHILSCKDRKIYTDNKVEEELNQTRKELIKIKEHFSHSKEDLLKITIENKNMKERLNDITEDLKKSKEDYNKLAEQIAKTKSITNNNNYNNTYNLKFQEAFEKLPEFSSENILKALIKNISSSSIKSEDFFINDVVKTIKDYTIVTDPSRGKAYIKNEEGLKEKTYTEKIVRNTLGIYKEEGHRLCEKNRSKIPDNEIYTDHNIKMSGNMGSIQCYLNTSSSDRINDLTIKGGNKLSKEGILILKTEEQKELLITFNIDE